MKTLTIKDSARSEQLDRTAMAGVRGGRPNINPLQLSQAERDGIIRQGKAVGPGWDTPPRSVVNDLASPAHGLAFVNGVDFHSNIS